MKKVIEVEKIKEAFGDMREGYPKATNDMVSVKDIFKIIDELANESDKEKEKRWNEYEENRRKCCPCDYCNNPKKLTSLCTEYACYGYSRFEPKLNTPSYVLDKIEDMQDSLSW